MTLLLINCILQISLFSVPMTMCLSTHNNDCGRTQNMRCFIRAVVMSSGFQVKPSSSVFLASGMRCLACGCRILPSILVVWKFHVRSSTNDFNMLVRQWRKVRWSWRILLVRVVLRLPLHASTPINLKSPHEPRMPSTPYKSRRDSRHVILFNTPLFLSQRIRPLKPRFVLKTSTPRQSLTWEHANAKSALRSLMKRQKNHLLANLVAKILLTIKAGRRLTIRMRDI